MAKDPAFLFYSSDFLTGTMFFTNEQVGIYMRLLCAQHQHGGFIDKKSFLEITEKNEVIRKKFIETEEGYFNERLKQETNKRSSFCESRRLSRMTHVQRTSDVRQSYVQRMENENENENVIINKDIKKNTHTDYFNKIWKDYPKPIGKKQALRYFLSSVKDADDLIDIEKALENYKNCNQVKTGFIQNGSTWFNNWRDWVNFKEIIPEIKQFSNKLTPPTQKIPEYIPPKWQEPTESERLEMANMTRNLLQKMDINKK